MSPLPQPSPATYNKCSAWMLSLNAFPSPRCNQDPLRGGTEVSLFCIPRSASRRPINRRCRRHSSPRRAGSRTTRPRQNFTLALRNQMRDVGVTKDMASLALNPAHLSSANLVSTANRERLADRGDLRHELCTSAGDFGDMDDAAIMLELKAGNMAGFDFLLNKYRKPIINFMYRMTRNQAVAEELAQEVFPARLPLTRDLPRGGTLQHLALPHRHQSRRESRARHPPRAFRLHRLPRRSRFGNGHHARRSRTARRGSKARCSATNAWPPSATSSWPCRSASAWPC